MLSQPSLLDEKRPLHLQVEANQAASYHRVATWRRSRFLWTGLGVAVLMLIGISACALHPLFSHASTDPSHLVAFMPGFDPLRSTFPARSRREATAALRAAVLPGFSPASSFSIMKQPLEDRAEEKYNEWRSHIHRVQMPENAEVGSPTKKNKRRALPTPGDVYYPKSEEDIDNDAFVAILNSRTAENGVLLTREEEVVLSRRVQKLVRWQGMLAVLEEHSQNVSLQEWAEACDFQSATEFVDAFQSAIDAKQAFMASNMGLVVSIVYKYKRLVTRDRQASLATEESGILSLQDLIQEGTIGLARAVEKFDPDRGIRFSTYSYYQIKAAVLHAVSQKNALIRVPVGMQYDLRKLNKALNDITLENGPDKVLAEEELYAELMERLNVSKRRVLNLLKEYRKGRFERRTISTEDLPAWRPLPDKEADEFAEQKYAMKEDVKALLRTLRPDEAELVMLRYGIGNVGHAFSLKELGAYFDVSPGTVSGRVTRVLRKLQLDARNKDLSNYLSDPLR